MVQYGVQDNTVESCEKLKASEGLLIADEWEGVARDDIINLIEQETQPYLTKNYILIGGRALKSGIEGYLTEYRQKPNLHPIIADAIDYLFFSGFGNVLITNEPSVLEKYYARHYPDTESDTRSQDNSPPGWLPALS